MYQRDYTLDIMEVREAFNRFSKEAVNLAVVLENSGYNASEQYPLRGNFGDVVKAIHYWSGIHMMILGEMLEDIEKGGNGMIGRRY